MGISFKSRIATTRKYDTSNFGQNTELPMLWLAYTDVVETRPPDSIAYLPTNQETKFQISIRNKDLNSVTTVPPKLVNELPDTNINE